MKFLFRIGGKMISSGFRRMMGSSAKKVMRKAGRHTFKRFLLSAAGKAGGVTTAMLGGGVLYKVYTTSSSVVGAIGNSIVVALYAFTFIFVLYAVYRMYSFFQEGQKKNYNRRKRLR